MATTEKTSTGKSAKAQSSAPKLNNSKAKLEKLNNSTPEPQGEEQVLTTAEQEAKLIERLNKLLVVTTENGASETEAEFALLKAQKLMYKYNISLEKLGGEEAIEYGFETMEYTIKASPRWALSSIIAKSFACRAIQIRGRIAFLGHKMDAKAALEAFKFAWKYLQNRGEALQRERKVDHGDAHGVFNTYAQGFLAGLKAKMDEQTVALTIIVSADVNDEFNRRFPNVQSKKSKMAVNPVDVDAFMRGMKDGRAVMGTRELPA